MPNDGKGSNLGLIITIQTSLNSYKATGQLVKSEKAIALFGEVFQYPHWKPL